MNRSLAPLVVIALAACTSSTPSSDALRSSPSVRRSVVTVETSEADRISFEVPTGGEISTGRVPAAVDELWPALGETYAQLGLEVNTVDTGARLLGVKHQRVRRIGGKRPSEYLDCGSGLNGIFANSYDVTLTVLTQLRPAPGGGTDVHTLLHATAKDPAHGNNAVQCASTLKLERRILDELQGRVPAGGPGGG